MSDKEDSEEEGAGVAMESSTENSEEQESSKVEVSSAKVIVEQALPEGFQPVDTSKLLWSPRVAFDRGAPDNMLRGYLISLEVLGKDSKQAFEAFLVHLTQEALCVDRHGKPIRAKEGSHVFVKNSYEFEPWLSWSMNPEFVFEIAVIPIGEREWEGGDKCFTYKQGLFHTPQPRAIIAPNTLARFAPRR